MSDAIIHAKVSEDTEEWLEEWADAVGCSIADVAGDALEQYREEGERQNTND